MIDSRLDDVADLLAEFAEPHTTEEALLQAERRNLKLFGYGVKGFVLSMIETAIELSDGAIPASQIQRIIEQGNHKELFELNGNYRRLYDMQFAEHEQ